MREQHADWLESSETMTELRDAIKTTTKPLMAWQSFMANLESLFASRGNVPGDFRRNAVIVGTGQQLEEEVASKLPRHFRLARNT